METGLEDLGDAGMTESAEQLSLRVETAFQTRGERPRTEELQGDGALGVLLSRLVDHRHAAVSEKSHDTVTADLLRRAVPLHRRGVLSVTVAEKSDQVGHRAL